MTPTIDTKEIINEYNQADAKGKALLSKVFGKDLFDQKITDNIKTYEDACRLLKVEGAMPFKVAFLNNDQKAVNAFAKLTLIARALNEGWIPDWNDEDQYKYVPYFNMGDSGDGFSCHRYNTWDTATDAGSRLCFRTADLAKYCAETFIDLYRDFLTL